MGVGASATRVSPLKAVVHFNRIVAKRRVLIVSMSLVLPEYYDTVEVENGLKVADLILSSVLST